MAGTIDPLISRALQLFEALHCGPRAEPPKVDEVVGRLVADELVAASSLDVGIWGQSVFRAAAQRAARVRAIATGGEDAP